MITFKGSNGTNIARNIIMNFYIKLTCSHYFTFVKSPVKKIICKLKHKNLIEHVSKEKSYFTWIMEYKHREKNQRDTDSLYFVEIWEENKNVHSDGWKGKKKKK